MTEVAAVADVICLVGEVRCRSIFELALDADALRPGLVDEVKAVNEGDEIVVESEGTVDEVEAIVAGIDEAVFEGSAAPVGADGQFAVNVEWVFGSAPGMF